MLMKSNGRSRNMGVPIVLQMMATFLATPVKAAGKPGVELIELAPLSGDGFSTAAAINDTGEVVGTSARSAGGGLGLAGVHHAVVYRHGRISKLCNEPATATAINDAGQIVGSIYSYSTNIETRNLGFPSTNVVRLTNVIVNTEAVLFRLGTTPTLLESTNPSYATGINNQAEIVGGISVLNEIAAYAFAYQRGATAFLPCPTNPVTMMAASAINNDGDIVGFKTVQPGNNSSGEEFPFFWHQGLMQDLGTLGGNTATATAVNDSGEVVGWSSTVSNQETHAFLYREGEMIDLGRLPGAHYNPNTNNIPFNPVPPVSVAYAINNWGMIVGQALTATDLHAFIYSNGRMTDLNNLVKLTRVGGRPGFVELTGANGINDVGQIVGVGNYWDGRQETTRAFLLDLHL